MSALLLGDALSLADATGGRAALAASDGLVSSDGVVLAALPIRARYRIPRRVTAFIVPGPDDGSDPIQAVPLASGAPPWVGPAEANVPHTVDLSALTGSPLVLPASVTATASLLIDGQHPVDASAFVVACAVAAPGAVVVLGNGAQQVGGIYVVALSVTLTGSSPSPARTVWSSLRCIP